MPTDASQLIHLCPVCEKPFRAIDDVREHIEESNSGAHKTLDPYDLDRPIPSREPQIEPRDFSDWEETVREFAEDPNNRRNTHHDKPAVNYTDVSDELPNSYVIWELQRQGYHPVPGSGVARTPTSWDELLKNQQDTLLAWVYFPDLSQREIGELDMSGHNSQSEVSHVSRQYGWMLQHPEMETPVEPIERIETEEGALDFEGMDPEKALAIIGGSAGDDGPEPGKVTSPEEFFGAEPAGAEPPEKEAGSTDAPGTYITSKKYAAPEKEAGSTDATPGGSTAETGKTGIESPTTATLDRETCFEVIVAAAQNGDVELAREVWESLLNGE